MDKEKAPEGEQERIQKARLEVWEELAFIISWSRWAIMIIILTLCIKLLAW